VAHWSRTSGSAPTAMAITRAVEARLNHDML